MAVGPVTLNGMIPRTQDIGMIKQHEDSKPMIDQQNIQSQIKTQEHKQLKQVNHADDTEDHEKRYDAKEKGSNEYRGQRQKKKKPKEQETENSRVSYSIQGGRFDMKY